MMKNQRIIFEKGDINKILERLTYEIIEKNQDTEDLVLIGIRRRGVTLAKRLQEGLKRTKDIVVPVGALDITLYRDDLSEIASQPVLKKTEIRFPIKGKKVILVDDVIYTGRTVRAALDGIIDLGRPKLVQLAVLIDRGHRELPIKPDYVGKSIPTSRDEAVEVRLWEEDGEEKIVVEDYGSKEFRN